MSLISISGILAFISSFSLSSSSYSQRGIKKDFCKLVMSVNSLSHILKLLSQNKASAMKAGQLYTALDNVEINYGPKWKSGTLVSL